MTARLFATWIVALLATLFTMTGFARADDARLVDMDHLKQVDELIAASIEKK